MTHVIYSGEYREFIYHRSLDDDRFCLMFQGKLLIEFEVYELMVNFCDNAINVIEQVPLMQDYKLHLTGCKRCKRTADGVKLDPCRTGGEKFLNVKAIIEHVVQTMAADIVESRRHPDVISEDGDV